MKTAAVLGVDAYVVDVEVDVTAGLPAISTVGLAQSAVKEGKERVLSAIHNSGYEVPPRKVTINLAPADTKKHGSHFDLPIACGVMTAAGQLRPERRGYALVGELGLDGSLRPIRGALAMAFAVKESGIRGLIVPSANGPEVAIADGIDIRVADRLADVVSFLAGATELESPPDSCARSADSSGETEDLRDVRGQIHAKRALEIAAAGAHNVLLVGPPGGGKTMLARRISTILPSMSRVEAIEATRIHSIAGELQPGQGLLERRPFRAPHHSTTDAGLVGGGAMPRPGEVSLAHHGVLFLDELTEFPRNVLEALRQPMEDGQVTIGRAARALTFPTLFVLAAAMNPCPCGHLGDGARTCRCSPSVVERYRARVSGPLLDRFDLRVEVPAVKTPDLMRAASSGPSSEDVRARVEAARAMQKTRFEDSGAVFANGQMTPRQVNRRCRPDEDGIRLLETAVDRFSISARSYHRVLKTARTIADLDGDDRIATRHIAEALQYRVGDPGGPENRST